MKRLTVFLILFLVFLFIAKPIFAIYDPISVSNNKFGIHILFPEELDDAAKLVNSSGGDWGYVTVPIQDSDRDLVKWQKFMDHCKKLHVIPIIRIATEGDYFVKGSWLIPSNYYIIDFANFLNSLNWPTKNHYVVIFNEPNRGDEWGGTPDASAYANILNYAVDTFKQRNDKFFIIMAALDNASANINGSSVNQLDFIKEMNDSVPGIFGKIDGIATHSYPNPAFASPPSYLGQNSINSFSYEQNLAKLLGDKTLPVFITETGWSTNSIAPATQAQYYKQAFADVWSDKSIVAVTPFLLTAGGDSFKQFSFIVDGTKSEQYIAISNLPKVAGKPNLEPNSNNAQTINLILDTKSFTDEFTKSIYNKINTSSKTFFKWLLGI